MTLTLNCHRNFKNSQNLLKAKAMILAYQIGISAVFTHVRYFYLTHGKDKKKNSHKILHDNSARH